MEEGCGTSLAMDCTNTPFLGKTCVRNWICLRIHDRLYKYAMNLARLVRGIGIFLSEEFFAVRMEKAHSSQMRSTTCSFIVESTYDKEGPK